MLPSARGAVELYVPPLTAELLKATQSCTPGAIKLAVDAGAVGHLSQAEGDWLNMTIKLLEATNGCTKEVVQLAVQALAADRSREAAAGRLYNMTLEKTIALCEAMMSSFSENALNACASAAAES